MWSNKHLGCRELFGVYLRDKQKPEDILAVRGESGFLQRYLHLRKFSNGWQTWSRLCSLPLLHFLLEPRLPL